MALSCHVMSCHDVNCGLNLSSETGRVTSFVSSRAYGICDVNTQYKPSTRLSPLFSFLNRTIPWCPGVFSPFLFNDVPAWNLAWPDLKTWLRAEGELSNLRAWFHFPLGFWGGFFKVTGLRSTTVDAGTVHICLVSLNIVWFHHTIDRGLLSVVLICMDLILMQCLKADRVWCRELNLSIVYSKITNNMSNT